MALLRGCLAALLVLAGSAAARAEDLRLAHLHALIAPLRRAPPVPGVDARGPWNYQAPGTDWRGATPALNEAKRTLRDWIEARLASAPQNVRARGLVAELNSALARADLFCQRVEIEDAPNPCSTGPWDWDPSGFLVPNIRIERPTAGVLLVYTGIGILCGTDMSAYGYEWRAGRWQRFWEYEQPIAKGVDYRPQSLESVLVSKAEPSSGSRMVLMLGSMEWCSSAYYPVYFRLWRAYSNGSEPKLLLDIEQPGYVGDTPVVTGRVSLQDAFIEFDNDGFDPDYPFYSAIRHFRIDGDTVTRIEPFAFNPRSFVEEWLAADWSESQRWSSPDPALQEWHRKIHGLNHDVAFIERSQHCADRSLWQASLQLGPDDHPTGDAYFIVRWRPPDRFEMVSIGAAQRVDCTGEGPAEREFAPLLPDWLSQ